MQVRWHFKFKPNQAQIIQMSEWLIALRKHRNYALRERVQGFTTNNQNCDGSIVYARDSYCDLSSKISDGSSCPLTCPVVKHGVIPDDLELAWKKSKGIVKWDTASGIQITVTTQLRHEYQSFGDINSDVLQRNIAKLDTAFNNFWKQGKGFARAGRKLNSFESKPNQVKVTSIKDSYAIVYLPGIGYVKMFNSRDLNLVKEMRICTVKRTADYWFVSILVELPEELRETKTEIKSVVGIELGVNKLVAWADGNFIENIRPTTNIRTARRLAIRQPAASRQVNGSKNQVKAEQKISRNQYKLSQKRDGYNWQAASIGREDPQIKNQVKPAKPKHDGKGAYLKNGASRKTGLNKVILDCGWGDLFNKIAWLATKSGKPVVVVNPKHSSQVCPKCGQIDKANRRGEKFICTNCTYTDHADTKAAQEIALRVGLLFPSKSKKLLPARKLRLVDINPQGLRLGTMP